MDEAWNWRVCEFEHGTAQREASQTAILSFQVSPNEGFSPSFYPLDRFLQLISLKDTKRSSCFTSFNTTGIRGFEKKRNNGNIATMNLAPEPESFYSKPT